MGNSRTDSGTPPQKKRAMSQKQFNREMDQLVNEEQLYYDELADYYDNATVTDARDQPTQRKKRKTTPKPQKRKTTPKPPKKNEMTQRQLNLEMNRVVQLNYDDLDDESRDLLHKQRDKFNEPHRRANMNEAQKQHKLALDQKRRDNRTEEETTRHNIVYPKQWRSNLTDEKRAAVNKAASERRRVRKDPSLNDGRGVSYKDYL